MEFRETLLAAQRNQQQKSSENAYYKARFDPPKKEQKAKDKLSANIQKFLAKQEEEEKRKKLEAQRKKEELIAMRDPKALRKIQKTLKVIKSANKSVIEDAVDREHTAVTREGPSQPDQDDYGYESQEAAAIYQKMMEKYSKIPDVPKFPTSGLKTKKDLDGTRERVKHALLHEDEPVPHKRKRKTDHEDKEPSPPPKAEPERKKDEKPKFRKPAPPPMDFNQLLKLAEQKKCEPLEAAPKKVIQENEPERLMTKKQKREYEEEMARRMRRQERLAAEKGGGQKREPVKTERPVEKRSDPSNSGNTGNSFGRIPKLGDAEKRLAASNTKSDIPKSSNKHDSEKVSSVKEKSNFDKEKANIDRDKANVDREKANVDRDKADRLQREKDKARAERDKLEKLKAERERIERDIERLNKDRERLAKLESVSRSTEKPRPNHKEQESRKSIDLKTQNTYRIDKNSNEKKSSVVNKGMNGHSSHGKPVPKDRIPQLKQRQPDTEQSKHNGFRQENGKKISENHKNGIAKRPDDVAKKPLPPSKPSVTKQAPVASKPAISNNFDFDKHVSSLKNEKRPNGAHPSDAKRKMHPDHIKRKQQMMKRRVMDSESEYDSEMDDFIDDGDEGMDYSKHIKEIFGYDRSRYKDLDDDDDPSMESSFSRQMREEYVSKKIGIMEDLEDMKLEKLMKKKKRRISDD